MRLYTYIIFMSFLISGCSNMKKEYIISKSGIDRCVLDTMTFNEGATPDITDVNFIPDNECSIKVLDSLEVVGGSICRELLIEKDGCHYYNDSSTIFFSRRNNIYNISIID